MRLTRLITWQLRAFLLIAVAALGLTFVSYARVPSMAGIGVYDVTVDFGDASGLYPTAEVTYHGVEIGKVASLDIGNGGAIATLRIDDGVHIPAGARAELHSTSAIGEQYVDLVSSDSSGPYLGDGSQIPRSRAIPMPQITPVLDSLNRLLAAVPRAATRRVLDGVGTGLGGSSHQLGDIIDSSRRLLASAQAHVRGTESLIAALRPVLATQSGLGRSTRRYAAQLNRLTATLSADDSSDLRSVLAAAPPGLDALTRTITGLEPSLPMFLTNATTDADVLNAYRPNIQQLMVVYPVTIARLQGVANPRAAQGDARFDLRGSFNDPPACSSGYLPRSARRSPSVTTTRYADPLAHCDTPASDPTAVRGARNLPCPNSVLRGPVPAACGLRFRSGVWPQTGGSVAYDLMVGRRGSADELDVRHDTKEELWKILVLAPLSVR
ncbi:MAG TPA: MlaD family protein [Nocardioides sp.]|nr:MlaD family protein [Nocardioides sp.]